MDAARDLLVGDGGAGFTVDAVAARAGVARMTVYYQFGSKRGLRDALARDIVGHTPVPRPHAPASRSVALDALAEYIGTLVAFWAADRLAIGRLRHLAAIDPLIDHDVRAGDEHRREALRDIVRRVAEQHGRPSTAALEDVVRVLFSLTGFEAFDAMAGQSRPPEDVATLLIRAAHALLVLDA